MPEKFVDTGRGFLMNFENGWTVNVLWAYGSEGGEHSAQICAWESNGSYYNFQNGEDVKGWQTPEEVAAFIFMISES